MSRDQEQGGRGAPSGGGRTLAALVVGMAIGYAARAAHTRAMAAVEEMAGRCGDGCCEDGRCCEDCRGDGCCCEDCRGDGPLA